MDELQQEQFTKALLGLVDLAKTKKNVLQYGEINDAFKGLELTEDKMDLVLEPVTSFSTSFISPP